MLFHKQAWLSGRYIFPHNHDNSMTWKEYDFKTSKRTVNDDLQVKCNDQINHNPIKGDEKNGKACITFLCYLIMMKSCFKCNW